MVIGKPSLSTTNLEGVQRRGVGLTLKHNMLGVTDELAVSVVQPVALGII